MQVDSVIIRRSPVILVYRIIWMTVIFYALTALILPFIEQSFFSNNLRGLLSSRIIWSFVIFSAESLVIIILFIQWSLTTYEIKQAEIIFRSGFLRRNMDIHSLRNIQTVYTTQTVLGSLFRYGTVRLFNPMSKEELLLHDVTDPEKYAQTLRQVLDAPSQETVLRTRQRG